MSNLLDAVARYPEPVSLKVLAAETGLHSSTAFRILNSMVDNGFAERDTYVARTNLPAYTRNTINDLPRLNKEAQQLRTQGYAFDNEEAEIGVGCIGALIYDATGNIVAGLSVSAPIERRQSEWIDNLLQAARQISEELGYRESYCLVLADRNQTDARQPLRPQLAAGIHPAGVPSVPPSTRLNTACSSTPGPLAATKSACTWCRRSAGTRL